jgi:hypothetical protein
MQMMPQGDMMSGFPIGMGPGPGGMPMKSMQGNPMQMGGMQQNPIQGPGPFQGRPFQGDLGMRGPQNFGGNMPVNMGGPMNMPQGSMMGPNMMGPGMGQGMGQGMGMQGNITMQGGMGPNMQGPMQGNMGPGFGGGMMGQMGGMQQNYPNMMGRNMNMPSNYNMLNL